MRWNSNAVLLPFALLAFLAAAALAAGCGESGKEPRAARDAAIAYVEKHYDGQAPQPGLKWHEEASTPPIGIETYNYRAGDWTITVSHPSGAQEFIGNKVVIDNARTGFHWEGHVGPTEEVIEEVAPSGG